MSSNQYLKVTPEKGQLGLYVALSYCWGGPQTFCLRKDNLERLTQKSTHSPVLPQTLKDAVLVTHQLGFEYLWIDALCIIQDSTEDKSHEISQMRNIYQNASITIAAATASSVNEGFLHPPTDISGRYSSCSVPVHLSEKSHGEQGTLIISPVHTQKTKDFPINKRGWTYQEALVSLRLLVFGDLEPFLRCQTKEATIIAPTYVAYDARAIEPQRFMDKIKSGPGYNVIFEDGGVIDLRLEFLWKDLVEQYTHRELGLQEDRPYAIAGVIETISSFTGDQCVYGIWKSCPIACLLWKLALGRESVRIPGLPTWSWMSVTGPVELDSIVYLKRSEATIEWSADPSSTDLKISCRVIEEAELFDGSKGDQSALLLDWMLDLGEMEMVPHSESRQRPPVNEQLSFLIIGSQTDKTLLALIATSAGGDAYCRCGVAELKSSGIVGSKQSQSITIK
ncbi:unnamed protein product [Clonostachys rosea]|uniref:Heterokaryon incompatibility domain-containing protein n=1 Tax=Bionectria ochroleuca TaxID=29856 RepID=A0ABY6U933_BIOOC|nr:unnamed protein product [Clonostachys rosea]